VEQHGQYAMLDDDDSDNYEDDVAFNWHKLFLWLVIMVGDTTPPSIIFASPCKYKSI
jgi:hypothetical protein